MIICLAIIFITLFISDCVRIKYKNKRYNVNSFSSSIVLDTNRQIPVYLPKPQIEIKPMEQKTIADTSYIERNTITREDRKIYDKNNVLKMAMDMVITKFGEDEWDDFYKLIDRESGWQVGNINKSSGACGLGQSLPCSKLGDGLGNPEKEILWAMQYVEDRYLLPSIALKFQINNGWY